MSRPVTGGGYRDVLRLSGASRAFAFATFGRLSFGTVSLSLLFTVQRATGSFAVAGGVLAAFGATSLTMPVKSRFVDRYGQPRVLSLDPRSRHRFHSTPGRTDRAPRRAHLLHPARSRRRYGPPLRLVQSPGLLLTVIRTVTATTDWLPSQRPGNGSHAGSRESVPSPGLLRDEHDYQAALEPEARRLAVDVRLAGRCRTVTTRSG